MADQFVQSNTGMFVSARPLVRLARSDSLERPCWHNSRPRVLDFRASINYEIALARTWHVSC